MTAFLTYPCLWIYFHRKQKDFFNKDDSTMMVVLFTVPTSSDTTMSAIKQIERFTGEQAFIME